MNIRELRYIMAIYEEGSVTKAAEKLYISQPSLSKTLIKVENRLDIKIFDRSTSPFTLTEFGEEYIAAAQAILNLTQDMTQKIRDMKNMEKGSLRIGIPMTRATYYLPKILPSFKARFPEIDVFVTEDTSSNLEEYVLKGKLDIMIVFGPLENPRIDYQVIKQERLYLVTPPDYIPSHDGPLTFEYALQHLPPQRQNFILLHKGQRLRKIAEKIFKEYDLNPHIETKTRMVETVIKLCANGMGMTFTSDLTKNNMVYHIQPDYYVLNERFSIPVLAGYRKGGYLSKAAQSFIDMLKQIL